MHNNQVISIKEEEAIEDILNECSPESQQRYELDADLQHLLQQSEHNIATQYEQIAESAFAKNRMAIRVQEDDDFLQDILDMPIVVPEPQIIKEEDHEEVVNIAEQQKQYTIDKYEKIRQTQSKLQQNQIISLDNKYPKINHMSMYRFQYPIFNFFPSSTMKYLSYKKVPLRQITTAVTIHISNEQKWTIFAIGQLILAFSSESWKQPIILNPQRKKPINHMIVSACKKYLVVGLVNEILVYTIKAESLVLLKNFCQLPIKKISKIVFYDSSPIRLAVVDNEQDIHLITIEQGVLFTTSNVQVLTHSLSVVLDIDAFLFRKKQYLALVSRNSVFVYSSEGQLIAHSQLQYETTKDVKVRWRMNKHLTRPQLFVGYDKKILIYKFIEENQAYLDLHLQYTNHYDIIEMQLISETHLLIRSQENIIIIAIPLIPSSSIGEEATQTYESAIVFISSHINLHLLYVSFDEIMYYSDNEQALKIAQLRTLTSYLDQLMIHKGCYREAFVLLILIFKGVNYSFKFSYLMDDLCSCIYTAIENALSSLIPALDQNIIEFRVGWVSQLAIQTRQQHLIWSLVYRKLRQKKFEHILFNLLELFILRSQIKNIPEQIFFMAIKIYCALGHDSVVQKMIINNQQPYDGTRLLSLIQLSERFYLQFFLFAKGIVSDQPDFYTPFVKVFSSFKVAFEKKDKEKTEEIGMMCFWFLRKCLMFEQIPEGMMTFEEKICVVTNFLSQIIESVFIKKLSQFNVKVFLETYLLLFVKKQLFQMIQQYSDLLIQKYIDYNEPENPEEIKNCDYHQILLMHFRKILPTKKYQLLWSEFESLAFYYSRCPMTFQNMIDVLIVLFENKFHEFTLQIPKKIQKPSIEKMQTEMIYYIKPTLLMKKDRFYMNKLLSFGDRNINYLLHKIDQNYKLSLESYLLTKPIQNLIPYIFDILQDWQTLDEKNEKFLKERKKLQIKEFLVKNMNLLFRTEKNQALTIFYMVGQTTQSIYAMIEESLGEKINFLTAVLLKFQNQDFDLKEKFLLDHLSEVCQLPEEEMISYLNTFYYPLDPAIHVCEQKGNLLAKAILEERAGYIDGSFRSYERLIRNAIYSGKYTQKNIRGNVQKYVEQCIRLCKKFSDETSTQNYWLRIITFINSFIISNNQQKIFLKVEFEKILQFVLNEIFQFLPTTLLIDFFTNPKNKLELSLTKEFAIYLHLFISIRQEISLSRKVIDVCRLDVKDNRKGALLLRRTGTLTSGSCDFCKGLLIEEQSSRLYYCGHAFHLVCHDDPYKCLTCYYESQNSLLSVNIFGTQMRKTSFDWERRQSKQFSQIREIYIESEAAARYQQNKKRLKMFDYNQGKKDEEIFSLNIPQV